MFLCSDEKSSTCFVRIYAGWQPELNLKTKCNLFICCTLSLMLVQTHLRCFRAHFYSNVILRFERFSLQCVAESQMVVECCLEQPSALRWRLRWERLWLERLRLTICGKENAKKKHLHTCKNFIFVCYLRMQSTVMGSWPDTFYGIQILKCRHRST